jgi:hypothetical protein
MVHSTESGDAPSRLRYSRVLDGHTDPVRIHADAADAAVTSTAFCNVVRSAQTRPESTTIASPSTSGIIAMAVRATIDPSSRLLDLGIVT